MLRGKYRLLNRIGEGSYGRVWVSQAPETLGWMVCAVKEVPSGHEGVELPAELHTYLYSDHPNVMNAVDFFFDSSTDSMTKENEKRSLYIVMELADKTLKEILHIISWKTRLEFCWQLGSAVQYLHRQKVSHCDIKPDNCFIFKGKLKLADFGLVKHYSIRDGDCQSVPMRPLSPGPVIPQTYDAWALGVNFFYIMTGRLPFRPDCMTVDIESMKENPVPYFETFLWPMGCDMSLVHKIVMPLFHSDHLIRLSHLDEVVELLGTITSSSVPNPGQTFWRLLSLDEIKEKEDPKVPIVTGWLQELFEDYSLEQLTRHATLTLFYHLYQSVIQQVCKTDSVNSMPSRRRIQLLAVTCCLLCSKLFDSCFYIDDAVYICAKTYTHREIRDMEEEIILQCKGQLYFHTLATEWYDRHKEGKLGEDIQSTKGVILDYNKYRQTDIQGYWK